MEDLANVQSPILLFLGRRSSDSTALEGFNSGREVVGIKESATDCVLARLAGVSDINF